LEIRPPGQLPPFVGQFLRPGKVGILAGYCHDRQRSPGLLGIKVVPDPSIGTVTPLPDTSSAGTQSRFGVRWELTEWQRGSVGRHYACRPPGLAEAIGAQSRHLCNGLGLKLGIQRIIREPSIRVPGPGATPVFGAAISARRAGTPVPFPHVRGVPPTPRDTVRVTLINSGLGFLHWSTSQ
jgi:hypothetical protein